MQQVVFSPLPLSDQWMMMAKTRRGQMARQVQNPGQRISADQAAMLVQSGMWLDYGAVLCQPDEFDKAQNTNHIFVKSAISKSLSPSFTYCPSAT